MTSLSFLVFALLPWLSVACVNDLSEADADLALRVPEDDLESLTPTCGAGMYVSGIDVSEMQGQIDWVKVKSDGIAFAYLRVADGLDFVDLQFAENWRGAKNANVLRGPYHFFRPSEDAVAQAEIFLETVGSLEPGDLPPVLDLEATDGKSPGIVSAGAKVWLDIVEQRLGVRPLLYVGPYFWRDQMGAPAWGRDYALWIAHWTSGCPSVPLPFTSWHFHQRTARGRVNGIQGDVDMNRFNGTAAALAAMAVQHRYDASTADGVTSTSTQGGEPGGSCASGCIWSTWAVSQGLQASTHTCAGTPCVCVVEGDAGQQCSPGSSSQNGTASFQFLRPTPGSVEPNPVSFHFAGANLGRIDVSADGWEILSFTPSSSGWAHSYTFANLGVRTVRASAYDMSGALIAEKWVTFTVDDSGDPSLGVPYFYQYANAYEPGSTCGLTSAAMLLNYWRPGQVSPDGLYLQYGKAQGQSPEGLAALYGYQGLYSRSTRGGTRSQLRAHLDAGRPVVVHGTWTGAGHIAVLRGYDDTGWLANDPAGDWQSCYGCNSTAGRLVHYAFGGGWDTRLSYDGDIWFSVADDTAF
ncbi:MAG: GH25 family lysozyme [Myxococcota bacterium]